MANHLKNVECDVATVQSGIVPLAEQHGAHE